MTQIPPPVETICLFCWTLYTEYPGWSYLRARPGDRCGDSSRTWQVVPCQGRLVSLTPERYRFYQDHVEMLDRLMHSPEEAS